jgi:hypothetical protein
MPLRLEKILAPVAVNLITAAAIFLTSLLFAPVREWVFGRDTYTEYPLFCRAEPFVDETVKNRLHIDFLITNKSDQEYDFVRLKHELQKVFGAETARSPQIILKRKVVLDTPLGKIVSAKADDAFNLGKGELVVKLDKSDTDINIEVRSIKEQSVLRTLIEVDGIQGLNPLVVDRRTTVQVPFYVEELEKNCFS